MKKAIVVGATSGIGRELSKLLVKNGYIVGIAGRRTDMLEALQAEHPDRYFIQKIDIKDIDAVGPSLELLKAMIGGLDLLVISSGTGEINKELDLAIELDTVNTNVAGFTAVANWAYKVFEMQQHGHLAAISSIAGIRGSKHGMAYNASKAYQINYLEGLRQRAFSAKLPVTITDARPGFVETAMAKGEGLFWVAQPEKAAKQILSAIVAKKDFVYVTKRWRAIAFLLRRLPGVLYKRM